MTLNDLVNHRKSSVMVTSASVGRMALSEFVFEIVRQM